MHTISHTLRARLVGVFILVAYSMLIYSITQNVGWGVATDILSGLAVIGIPVLMFPVFNTVGNQTLNYLYITSRIIEGALMLAGGMLILHPTNAWFREFIYSNIHIHFFIAGALFFYILLYRTQVVPRFISVWGIISTVLLMAMTLIDLTGLALPIIQLLALPIMLNEIFLAIWLIIKGFNFKLYTE